MKRAISPYAWPGIAAMPTVKHAYSSGMVMDCVCRYFKTNLDFITCRRRTPARVRLRQVSIHLLSQVKGLSLHETAAVIGFKDHTSIIHYRKYALNMIDTEPEFKQDVEAIQAMIRGRIEMKPE